ncbi:Pentatricopeptide repeat-containing protein [Raphanus sativus]|nr:Pentatricopeptide repeat-containing protein [Raphanus sativus]
MVDMFSMCGCLDKAREVFESMRRGKNLLVTVGLMRVELFERCCSVDGYDEWMGDLELGKWINGYIYENRVRVDKVVGTTALVDMYAKCGFIDTDSSGVFYETEDRDAASWTSLSTVLPSTGCQGERWTCTTRWKGLKSDQRLSRS